MNLNDWIGRSEAASDVITATPYAGLSGTLDWPASRPLAGTPLPALWHWLYFLPLHRQSEIGPDGHPRRGDFLPPVPLSGFVSFRSGLVLVISAKSGDVVRRRPGLVGL